METLQDQIDKMSKSIKTDNYPMSIGELAGLYRDGDLNISPIYQRLFRWDIDQQSALIESILLDIPIPPIYVFQDEDGKWSLIDGQQRLSTIFKFMGILKKSRDEEDENEDVHRLRLQHGLGADAEPLPRRGTSGHGAFGELAADVQGKQDGSLCDHRARERAERPDPALAHHGDGRGAA